MRLYILSGHCCMQCMLIRSFANKYRSLYELSHFRHPTIVNRRHGLETQNKTPAQAFTPPADEKKMGTIWIFASTTPSTAQAGADAGFLGLKVGGVLICKYGT